MWEDSQTTRAEMTGSATQMRLQVRRLKLWIQSDVRQLQGQTLVFSELEMDVKGK